MKTILLQKRIRLVLSFFFVFWIKMGMAQQLTSVPDDSQFLEKCAATYIEQKQIDQLGVYGTREFFEVWVEDKKREMKRSPYKFRTQADGKRQIPVVVHVIHTGTPLGQGANIPFAQIQAQIEILNQDYSRQNPDANNTPDDYLAIAASANIEFVLAKQDPNGLPTNGVNRVAGSKSVYTPDDDALIGQLALWPPEEYMNIWVVPLQSPYLGYSSFPISELPGLDFPPNTRETDGVTIDYRMFGSGGNASSGSAGRTATHEIGHYFGLRHIWGDGGGCEVDDFVEDTPNQSASNNSCPTSPRFSCDSRDMIENFMDYTPDRCMNLFTSGQVERMDVVLNFSPRRTSLINGRATQEPALSPNDLSLQTITNPQDFSCATDVVPQITVLNVGSNSVTSAVITITLNGVVLQSRNFSLNIEPGASANLSFNGISLSPAIQNEFIVEISSVNGSTDPDLSNNRLVSYPRVQPTVGLPYAFGGDDFSNLWALKNPDKGVTWSETISVIDGKQQDLLYLSGYNYDTQGELDYLISPRINLASAPNAQLKFKLAYAPYPNTDFQESLLVAVSTDCGNTFELLDAPYYKIGPSLETAEPTSDQFIPDTEQQFRTELVNLSPYAGAGDIRIAFVSINGFGNSIYIKDIEILATEKYRYDFEISRVVAPGPITDGSREEESLEITNTGNLPIRDFVIRREAGNSRSQTVVVEDETLNPGESAIFNLSASLNQGLTEVAYTISNPNYDQNPGSSSTLVWHYVRDDSTMSVPWRQNFDDPAGLGSWISLNPESNQNSWSPATLQAGEDNPVISLGNASKGASYWLGSPLFDLSKNTQASVFFNWAAAGFRSTDITSFSMLLSKDGGSSYEVLWNKDNEGINTLSGSGAAVTSSTDFSKQYIDLSAFTGEGYEKVRIAFKAEYREGSTHPIYLDDIELFLSANPEPVDPGLGNTVVFPNPAFDLFNVTFNLQDYEDVNLQIISSSGKVVHEVDYPHTLNQTYTFSTALFSKGVFIVKVTGDRISATKRLIIQ
jgi:hypothetical protein